MKQKQESSSVAVLAMSVAWVGIIFGGVWCASVASREGVTSDVANYLQPAGVIGGSILLLTLGSMLQKMHRSQ